VDFDTSATFGIRGGYWFEPVPWVGVAGDLSTFTADGDEAKFHLIPVSILVMLRLPLLTTDEPPGGRLHPYLGLGPSLVYQKATVDYRPEVDRKVKLSSVEIGFDARLGLGWQFHPAGGAVRRVPLHLRADRGGGRLRLQCQHRARGRQADHTSRPGRGVDPVLARQGRQPERLEAVLLFSHLLLKCVGTQVG
jgi:hypothetical protein